MLNISNSYLYSCSSRENAVVNHLRWTRGGIRVLNRRVQILAFQSQKDLKSGCKLMSPTWLFQNDCKDSVKYLVLSSKSKSYIAWFSRFLLVIKTSEKSQKSTGAPVAPAVLTPSLLSSIEFEDLIWRFWMIWDFNWRSKVFFFQNYLRKKAKIQILNSQYILLK